MNFSDMRTSSASLIHHLVYVSLGLDVSLGTGGGIWGSGGVGLGEVGKHLPRPKLNCTDSLRKDMPSFTNGHDREIVGFVLQS